MHSGALFYQKCSEISSLLDSEQAEYAVNWSPRVDLFQVSGPRGGSSDPLDPPLATGLEIDFNLTAELHFYSCFEFGNVHLLETYIIHGCICIFIFIHGIGSLVCRLHTGMINDVSHVFLDQCHAVNALRGERHLYYNCNSRFQRTLIILRYKEKLS